MTNDINPIDLLRDDEEPREDVQLSVSRESVKSFFKDLLGKPQIISKTFNEGSYAITIENIVSLDHILNARVKQQHDAIEVAFTAVVMYDDDSTVTYESFNQFRAHREARKVICVGADIQWTYLIHFPDKKGAEKQVVRLAITCPHPADSVHSSAKHLRAFIHSMLIGHNIELRIDHTQITWGNDIESVASKEINSWFRPFPKAAKYIGYHMSQVRTAISSIIIIVAFLAVYMASDRLGQSMNSVAAEMSTMAMGKQVEYLLYSESDGVWHRFTLVSILFISIVYIIGRNVSSWVVDKVASRPKSYLLFTEHTASYKSEQDKEWKKSYLKFWSLALFTILLNITASVLFVMFFERLVR